jgi:4'-phosphopantetheinyl transferase superfamily
MITDLVDGDNERDDTDFTSSIHQYYSDTIVSACGRCCSFRSVMNIIAGGEDHSHPTTILYMGILGIGVDVVFVPRITSLISRRGAPRLASRILSVPELSDWNASPPANQNRFLAVRYASRLLSI